MPNWIRGIRERRPSIEAVELIRPPSLYFSPRCVAVHGIHPADVQDALTFDAIWEKHQHIFEAYPIIAHNAAFDLNVLCASISTYGLACPYLEYSCSRLIARRAWPGRPSYALKATADVLGLQFKHHDALEDAKVCGQIVLAAAQESGTQTLDAMESALAIDRGRVQFGVRIAPKSKSRKSPRSQRGQIENASAAQEASSGSEKLDAARIAAYVARSILQACGNVKPLSNKHVVLSGRLLGLDRNSAVAFLEQLGGSVQSKINLQTQYVIVGTGDENQPCEDGMSSSLSDQQMVEVDKRSADGQAIRVLSQRQLLALIPGGSAAARALAATSVRD